MPEHQRADGPVAYTDGGCRGHSGDPGNERCDAIAGWFSSTVAPPAGGSTVRSSAPGPLTGARPVGAGGAPGTGVSYVSLVDGIVERHRTWADCERRVKGVR